MKTFKMILEQNEIKEQLSNKYKAFKEYILDNLDFTNKEQLIELLTISIDTLENSGKNTVLSLQTTNDKLNFISENHQLIDSVLNDTDWYFTSPNQLNIKDILMWNNKAVDVATLNCLKSILDDLK